MSGLYGINNVLELRKGITLQSAVKHSEEKLKQEKEDRKQYNFEGSKYRETKNLSITEINKLIREDIQKAVKNKQLPQIKVNVTQHHNHYIDIIVTDWNEKDFSYYTRQFIVKEYEKDFHWLNSNEPKITDKAIEIKSKLEDIGKKHNQGFSILVKFDDKKIEEEKEKVISEYLKDQIPRKVYEIGRNFEKENAKTTDGIFDFEDTPKPETHKKSTFKLKPIPTINPKPQLEQKSLFNINSKFDLMKKPEKVETKGKSCSGDCSSCKKNIDKGVEEITILAYDREGRDEIKALNENLDVIVYGE
jgi:hypothetical protein